MNRLLSHSICVVLIASCVPAFGAIVINGPTTHIHQLVIPPDSDVVTLNPDPVTYLASATAAMQGALANDFPTWTFTYAAGGLNGTLQINRYEATTAGPHNGGGLLEVTYTRAATDPAIANLHWVQMVDTNDPLGGLTSPYIDPRPNDDTLPFYWTIAEDGQAANGNKTATTYHFFDNSRRTLGHPLNSIYWRGELMLASWDGVDPGNVTIYDGIRWGWDLQSTPEPSTLVLCLIGAAGLGLHRAAQKRRR